MTDLFDPVTLVARHQVVGTDTLQCDNIIPMLYSAVLTKYRTIYSQKECQLFTQYQNRIFDLVEEMRTLHTLEITKVLEHLHSLNEYLPDIVIMFWCQPRKNKYWSQAMYKQVYAQMIENYNGKMIALKDHSLVSSFCMETLSNTNSVPIHCIDYLWFYMDELTLQFDFLPSHAGSYANIVTNESDDCVQIAINMPYLMDIGLGKVTKKGICLRYVIKQLVTKKEYVEAAMHSKTYQQSKAHILAHANSYFADT